MNILNLLIILPIISAVIIFFINKNSVKKIKQASLLFFFISFILSLYLFFKYNTDITGFQFLYKKLWIAKFNIFYSLGADGLSVIMIILTNLLFLLSYFYSIVHIEKENKLYSICLFFLQAAIIGSFCALDIFLFYIFWEAMLIPMFLLIGVWGHGRRIYSAIKFVLFTMAGSVFLLIAIIFSYVYIGRTTGVYSFEYSNFLKLSKICFQYQSYLFIGFILAFAIKVPLFPLHTWLPDAHTEAPTAGSVILAGVLLKLGAYGFLRFAIPFFPAAALFFAKPLILISAFAVVYAALVAFAQTDMKKLVAYSSVSHMGMIIIGIFAFTVSGLNGAMLQMLNHGINTGALFLGVGMLYARTHTREIKDYSGISVVMPKLAAMFVIASLASIALPSTNGFIGEILILFGAFKKFPAFVIFAGLGIILGAVYMLTLVKKVFYNNLHNDERIKNLKDIKPFEILSLFPLIILIFWIGIYPNYFLKYFKSTTNTIQKQIMTVHNIEVKR